MKNPIPKSTLFKTTSLEQIQEMIESMPKSDRASASLVLMMTINACHEMVEQELEKVRS